MSTPPAAPLRIALVGDHDPHITAHRAIPLALRLAGEALGLEIAFDWLASDRLPAEPALERYDGFWCVPGSPYRDADAVLRLIAHARGRRRPFLGTCAGFQHTILEFARNALGWQAATHGEEHPHSDQAVIAALPCALLEAREEVRLLRGSRLALAYAADWIEADYHCRYAIAPRFAAELTGGALRASAWSADGAIRAVELEQHPFFVATLFQPERAALAGVLPPLPKAFVEACRTQRRDRPRRGPTPYYAVI
ncbi:CTP synthase C-terminal region-related (seleno)protein, partial [Pseudomonas aeruginosa]